MNKVIVSAFAVYLLFCLKAIAAPSGTTAQLGPEFGLFMIKRHTLELAKAHFFLWAGNWEWRGTTIATGKRASFENGLTGGHKETGHMAHRSILRSAAKRMEWRVRVEPGSATFGGLSVKFNLAAFAEEGFSPQPEILPGEDGWSLKLAADEEQMKFVVWPTPSNVRLGQGKKDEVRVLFAKPGGQLAAGDHTMLLELPARILSEPSPADRLQPPGSMAAQSFPARGSIAPITGTVGFRALRGLLAYAHFSERRQREIRAPA